MASSFTGGLQILQELQLVRYTRLVATTVIFYDHLLTFGNEIELIWKWGWSLPQCLVLAIRYYALGVAVVGNYGIFGFDWDKPSCATYVRWETISSLLFSTLVQGFLMIRVYALYLHSKRVLLPMLAGFVISTAAAGYIAFENSFDQTSSVTTVFNVQFCTSTQLSNHAYAIWIVLLFFEGALCCMVLYNGYKNLSLRYRPRHWGQSLLDVIVRDSALMFILMGATYVACLIVSIKHNSLIVIPAAFVIMMSDVLCTRILLHTREAANEMNGSITLSTIVFATT
ncbi:hypothetical protein CPC08DRAFT_715511 [Agrocybe pediades]|nr:hypothetical protein CPC08DRAFT_715511 [Agrocybe pediades]